MSERGAAFRQWMEHPCWHEVKAMMTEIRDKSIKAEDSVPTAELTVQLVAEGRGVRKGLTELIRKIFEAAG
jgi:hypothetical protein